MLSVVPLQAREKYKTDCVNINLYHAQTKLVQGRDLEKVQMRLEKAKQTVQQNERDYSNSVDVLRDTCYKWEADWKVFCDVSRPAGSLFELTCSRNPGVAAMPRSGRRADRVHEGYYVGLRKCGVYSLRG
jgi:hypothetical protein